MEPLTEPVAETLRRGLRGFAAYFRGVMGADAYRKYLEHHEACGHPVAPMTEKQFWRDRMDRQDSDPQGRCC
ncbi:YbdD/YjiX family protein [Arthrobacter sp. R-11]|uniref:YbdD/YjiX family protein n=1 Tax=Arthrobacter sp. R-11 TaxID=3404053 RepID=UPI003CEE42EB